MRRIVCLTLAIITFLFAVSCSKNFSGVDLKEPITIPDNGIIEKSIFDEIKEENGIAIFKGECDSLKYEWTVFGKEVGDTRDINLALDIKKTEKGINIKFCETEDFGFLVHLAIYLDEKWNADSATAYVDKTAAYSVSLTGVKTTILNMSISKIYSECEIIADAKKYDDLQSATSSENVTTDSKPNSSKLPLNSNSSSSLSSITSDKDKYQTDPIPEGKPAPVEPNDKEVNTQKFYTCTFSIECSAILNNLSSVNHNKLELIPSDGIILEEIEVEFFEGESVFDVLKRVCQDNGIHLESEWTPIYNSAYIEGINNIYEKDVGELSGWQYRVNGWYPNYGCSRYQLKDGDKVEFRYTCDLGKDIGNDWKG